MFKKPRWVRQAPSSEHVNFKYDCPSLVVMQDSSRSRLELAVTAHRFNFIPIIENLFRSEAEHLHHHGGYTQKPATYCATITFTHTLSSFNSAFEVSNRKLVLYVILKSWAKQWALGCVSAAREGQEAGFAQPRPRHVLFQP